MALAYLTILLLALAAAAYVLAGKRLSRIEVRGAPVYYKWYAALTFTFPALLLLGLWSLGEPAILKNLVAPYIQASDNPVEMEVMISRIPEMAEQRTQQQDLDPRMATAVAAYRNFRRTSRTALGIIIASLLIIGVVMASKRIHPGFNARRRVEKFMKLLLLLCSTIAVMTTVGIVMSVLFESLRFFNSVPVSEFLFTTTWSPQATPGSYGSIPLFAGTLLISLIAMLVAAPIGLMSAIYLSEYASSGMRSIVKPLLEVLAGIPTVVYGFFAALTVAPILRKAGTALGLDVSAESALAAGLTMGVMLIPFISSLSDDVINAVPKSLREGSYGLGATRSETIVRVIIPAALPGIISSFLLAISRALGETMIVVMAAGFAAKLTANPFEAVTTVTVQITTLLVGDQEFDSPKTLAAFALGLTLFFATLTLNVIALKTVRKYREKYE